MRTAVVLSMAALALCGCASSGSAGPAARAGSTGATTARQDVVVRGDSESVSSVPSCQWPLDVSGDASAAQAGLIRCYLRALAHRSLAELVPLTSVVPGVPVTLTRADLRHAPDSAGGTASAAFQVNDSDPFNATVAIRFADGVRATIYMDARNVMEPASRSWRLDIGT